jgi:programmed cell death 8 (apoptosis-inducing factor)
MDAQHSPSTSQPSTPTSSSKEEDATNDDFGKGIVFYLKNDRVVGVLLWNLFHRTAIARQVISEQRAVDDVAELARLFRLHED